MLTNKYWFPKETSQFNERVCLPYYGRCRVISGCSVVSWIKKKGGSILKTVNDRTHGINYTVNSKQLWNYKHCLVKTFLITMPWCRWHSPVIPVSVILLERKNFFSRKSLSKKSCLPGELHETSCSKGLCHVLSGAGARARQGEVEEKVNGKKRKEVMWWGETAGSVPTQTGGWLKSVGTLTKQRLSGRWANVLETWCRVSI